ncbi:MAG: glycosyltransferase family 2 protein [Candidatus Hydrogenedentes bacterium]|nr:glycosyltransferase family 2 protein [Candidatus Hydrogenedentota bacterium]
MPTTDNPTHPPLAAIIVNRNKKDYLLRAVECAMKSGYAPLDITVVDDCSSDGSPEAVRERFPQVHVVEETTHAGATRVRNVGILDVRRRLAPKYLLFLDNDAFVARGAIGELVKAAERDPGAGIVVPKAFRSFEDRMLYSAGDVRVNLFTGTFKDVGAGELDRGQHDEPKSVGCCAGFAMLVRAEVLERIGLFDEAFYPYGWEDIDFALRTVHAGYRILYVPSAEVEHLGGKIGRGAVPAYEKSKAKNLITLMRKHAASWHWMVFLTVLPLRALRMFVAQLLRGEGKLCLAQIKGMLSILMPGRRSTR